MSAGNRFMPGRRSVLAGLCALPGLAGAQTAWKPDRPVSLIVPFSAGGTTDAMARLIAEPMGRHLGQTIVVENVTGAGGNIGAARVARAAADGQTALFAHVGVLCVNRYLYPSTGFDTERDFAPVGLVCTNPMALLVSAKSGIETMPQLLERARRGDLRIATAGNGSTMHLAAEQFLDATGGRADLIPYRGGAPAVTDLLAGTVDMLVEQAFSAIPNSRSGQARALLVTGPKRLSALPDVPTAAEAGLPGIDIEIWNAIVLPRAVAAPVSEAWQSALAAGLADPTVRARYEQFTGVIPTGEETAARYLGDLIARDSRRWGEVLKHGKARQER
jgi:tripartite-type tricarboxylate transporter receptor subunit TctC